MLLLLLLDGGGASWWWVVVFDEREGEFSGCDKETEDGGWIGYSVTLDTLR